MSLKNFKKNFLVNNDIQGRQTGGGLGGRNPPECWMGGLNTCQPPLILKRFLLWEVGSP